MANRVQPSQQAEKRHNAAPISILEKGEALVHKAVAAAGNAASAAYNSVRATNPDVVLRRGVEKAKEVLKKATQR